MLYSSTSDYNLSRFVTDPLSPSGSSHKKCLFFSRKVYECKPVSGGAHRDGQRDQREQRHQDLRAGHRRGLSLGHFLAQTEPFLTLETL